MLLKEVFEKSVQFFKDKKLETARLDAELLLSHALKCERLQIYLKYEQPLGEAELQACREVVRRRASGEPVAYILGEKGFYGEVFRVGPGVLIPRPETELVVEEALNFIQKNNLESPRVLDLGAGTGCIGFSILKNCRGARLVSVEKSPEAFTYLLENCKKLGLEERAELVCADVMEAQPEGHFDLIVANPPYIAENDPETEAMVKKFEPGPALFAAEEGLAALFSWPERFKARLKKPGIILLEMGYRQGAQVQARLQGLGFAEVKILKDLSGLDRVVKSTQ